MAMLMGRVGGRCGLVVAVWAAAGLVLAAGPGPAVLAAGQPLSGPSSAAAGGWGKAERVPGVAVLNAGGAAGVSFVSCWSAGNCGAVGGYTDASGGSQVFVAGERKGRWGKAEEVPGLAALNVGGDAQVYSLSCAPGGGCAAGGRYEDRTGGNQAFVVTRRDGRWGRAEKVPGTATLNKGDNAWLLAVSCTRGGNCGAGGFYDAASGEDDQAFVVAEKNGRWGKALKLPGTSALNKGGFAQVGTVSCTSAGNCGAGGYYTDRSNQAQALVVTERNGRWGTAQEVPGTAALNKGRLGLALVESVSCTSAGNCSAGGTYYRNGGTKVFVVAEKRGRWDKAEEVPGTTALNKYKSASAGLTSVSCASAGNCAAGGSYDYGGTSHPQVAFVVTQKNGRWGKAQKVPGLPAINDGGAQVNSMSCTSAANCTAGGSYTNQPRHSQAFVVTEQNGRWGKAQQVPGLATLNAGGGAGIASVSCTSARHCAAGGSYADGSEHGQAFVASQT